MSTAREARRRPPVTLDPETDRLLTAGKLEKTCPDCGRWEAASFRCTWCFRPFDPSEWYPNNDLRERHSRMPTAAPERPPTEYLNGPANWPKAWGPFPYKRGPRQRGTPVNPNPDEKAVHAPVQTGMAL